ncbi:MAG: alpha-D-ribose 1-methylphosphonate 5-triphosphate diphosphatase [Patiriisocius sp.]|jgi:alpha-D-ribose 1-methylphosphonate 5-triphosphate diphosphatase
MPFQSLEKNLDKIGDSVVINNVKVMTSQGWTQPTSLWVHGGIIGAIHLTKHNDVDYSSSQIIDGTGCYIVPGIIDLHGDAFERDITPRAGTQFPLDLALAANDASLIANGITTFYYSITDGFEPGPRSRDTVRHLLIALEKLMPRFSCQARVHIRHETVNTEKHDELLEWLRQGRIHLLSLNDHLPLMDNDKAMQRYLTGMRRRVSMSDSETIEFLQILQGNRALGETQLRELAALAQQQGVALASHDDATLDDVAKSISLGIAIAEFPMCQHTARASKIGGAFVLMGAPNLVRGGSHVGAISVNEAIDQKVVDVLCSDYHYPSLFHAPFMISSMNKLPFSEAWKLISENPARAAGLGSAKGKIAPGYDADFLILNELDGSPLSLHSTWVKGKMVYARKMPKSGSNPITV